MENKKTLWIIAAVGAFLLVVLGAAVIMYSPNTKSSQTITRVSPSERQNDGWSNPGNLNPANVEHQLQFPNQPAQQEPLKANEVYVVADKANVYEVPSKSNGTTIDLNSLKTLKESSAETPSQNINVTVTISDKNDSSEVANRAPRDFEKAPPAKPRPEVASKPAKPAPVAVKKAESKPKASAVKSAPQAPAAPSKYWVQVAAYSNKKGAETARSTLGTNQIQADIFTYKDNKDNLFYRVRVGPYTTKSEAEYWRQKIAKINDFASAKSYVTTTN